MCATLGPQEPVQVGVWTETAQLDKEAARQQYEWISAASNYLILAYNFDLHYSSNFIGLKYIFLLDRSDTWFL